MINTNLARIRKASSKCNVAKSPPRITPNSNSLIMKIISVEQHECKSDGDCSGIPNTSCAADPGDKRLKCLCADSQQPVAGDCRKLPKGN